jgi:hypothetical protein
MDIPALLPETVSLILCSSPSQPLQRHLDSARARQRQNAVRTGFHFSGFHGEMSPQTSPARPKTVTWSIPS